jgi:hypothetical protein
MLHKYAIKTVPDTFKSTVKLTVQSNIWISNKGMLIMVAIHRNRYRSMLCLYMMFLKKAVSVIQTWIKMAKTFDKLESMVALLE